MNGEGTGFQGEEIRGEWKVLCNKELKILYITPNLIREIELKFNDLVRFVSSRAEKKQIGSFRGKT